MSKGKKSEVHRWGMVYWMKDGKLWWQDKKTGEKGILTYSPDTKSDYQRIKAELS